MIVNPGGEQYPSTLIIQKHEMLDFKYCFNQVIRNCISWWIAIPHKNVCFNFFYYRFKKSFERNGKQKVAPL